jgi:hypothetical protein
MGRDVTFADLRSRVLSRGGYENSSDLTASVVGEFVNEAVAELYDLMVATDKDYYVTTADKPTTSGRNNVNLPTDFYQLRAIALVDSGKSTELVPFSVSSQYKWDGKTGTPCYYRLAQGEIILAPIPDSRKTIRLHYVPHATVLVADADEVRGFNGYEEIIVQMALLRCYKRQDQPTQETAAEIDRLKMRIKAAADGVDSKAFLLNPGGDNRSDDEEDWPWL